MKLKSLLFFLAFVTVSVTSYADKVPSMTVAATANASVYNVQYKSNEAGTVKIFVYNNSDKLLFNETLINVTSFNRPYNFSELGEGQYTIVLEDKNGKQAEKITYELSKVKSIISVKEVANEEDKYLFNVYNANTDVVRLRIYQSNSQLVYEQDMKVAGRFSVLFNLSKVKAVHAGKVTFEVLTSQGDVESISF